METIRTFIAIELPAPAKAALSQILSKLKAEKGLPVKWVDVGSIHLTLKFLGNVEAETVPEITEACSRAVSGVTPFHLQLGTLGAFPDLRSPRVVWIGVAGDLDSLKRLQQNVERYVSPLGFPTEDRPFSPHLTLGRVRDIASLSEKSRLGEVVGAQKPPSENPFKVDSLSLMRSTLTREGAIYDRQAGFALTVQE